MHFGFFSSKKFPLHYFHSFCYYLWNVFLQWYNFFKNGSAREKDEELFFPFTTPVVNSKLIITKINAKLTATVFVVAKMQLWHFFLTYLATGSLRNDQKRKSIPSSAVSSDLLESLIFLTANSWPAAKKKPLVPRVLCLFKFVVKIV